MEHENFTIEIEGEEVDDLYQDLISLEVELDDDPDLQASFSEALAAILAEFRDNWQKVYEELDKLRARIRSASKEPTYGLHRKKQMPFFRMFDRELVAFQADRAKEPPRPLYGTKRKNGSVSW